MLMFMTGVSMRRLKNTIGVAFLALLCTSCATATFSKYKGIGRIKQYDFYHADLPAAFDGFRIAFATDFHYESKFDSKRLPSLVQALQSLQADVLLLGGDYRGRNGGDVNTLFTALSSVKTPYGTYAVMGNHERGVNDSLVRAAMQATGVKLLEHRVDTLLKNDERLLIWYAMVFRLHCNCNHMILSLC